jgi:hypothetical protein
MSLDGSKLTPCLLVRTAAPSARAERQSQLA